MPVIPPLNPLLSSPADAPIRAVEYAATAAGNKTFGVGGLLINNNTGEVLAAALNQVIENEKVKDPTGHVERQLVDWYYDQKREGKAMPAPKDLTIVSSLDPCMMCCGAILTGGFNVIAVTLDTFAGVSYNGEGKFDSLPPRLQNQAKQLFSHFAIAGKRPFTGNAQSYFADTVISQETEQRSVNAFGNSLDSTRGFINAHAGTPPEQLTDPATLSSDHPVVAALRKLDPEALTVKTDPARPGVDILARLRKAADDAQSRGGVHNAVSLIDPFGNVLLTLGGREGEAPTRTAVMEITRAYATLRAELDDAGTNFLPHPKHLKTVMLRGPGQDPASIMDLGAFGSTMEGPLTQENPHALQYILGRQDQHQLDGMVRKFPPLYTDVIQLQPTQVTDPALLREAEKTFASRKAAI